MSLAASPAKPVVGAGKATLFQLSGSLHEANLLPLRVDLIQTVLVEISQTIRVQHIEITGVHTAVRLHHIGNAADAPLITGSGGYPSKIPT